MLLNSLLVALLLSDAASEPQLRGTSTSDVSEGASPDIIERAAVSNQHCPDEWEEVEELCCRSGDNFWTEWHECYEWDEVAIMTAPVQPPPNATSEMDSP